jgi:hypothetical protein
MLKLERSRVFLPLLLAAAAPFTATGQGNVWTVGTARDFSSLASAVAAAQDGDVLLLYSGAQGPLNIGGKSLTLQAAVSNAVIQGPITIHDLAPSQSVRLRGLRLVPTVLQNNAGLVWIEQCVCPQITGTGQPALAVNACADVVLLASSFIAPREPFTWGQPLPPPSTGLKVSSPSSVQAYDCTFEGAPGYYAFTVLCAAYGGTAGVSIPSGSDFFASGSVLRGGTGYDNFGCPISCLRGGAGLGIQGQAWLLDSQLFGGSSPVSWDPSCAGPPSYGFGGVLQELPGASTSLRVSSPVRENQGYTLEVHGPPNTLVFLQTSSTPAATLRTALSGVALLGQPKVSEPLGTTDSSGRLVVSRTATSLAPGVESAQVFFQVLTLQRGPSTPGVPQAREMRKILGAASMMVVLDETL